ncbi:MAG: hypothetical protein U0R19_30215 [Bryobacteraceae bacterium]
MAKALGFQPASLIRARTAPNQEWKLPVKEWIRERHRQRFGRILGEEAPPPQPVSLERAQ